MLHISLDQAAAMNNALRREIAVQERLLSDRSQIGVHEYVRHLDSALQVLTAGWEAAHR